VRFLVDAQLPPALARYLVALGHEAEHVAAIGLESASDGRIWDNAVAAGAILITKDEDFVTMRALSRQGGPVVVWMRVGNTTRRALIALFDAVFPAILEAIERGETVIQVPER
jgi:predicted nuclease of predicted toxin-antitoxin system